MISIIALTCFFCFLPVVFYVGAKLHSDVKERKSEYRHSWIWRVVFTSSKNYLLYCEKFEWVLSFLVILLFLLLAQSKIFIHILGTSSYTAYAYTTLQYNQTIFLISIFSFIANRYYESEWFNGLQICMRWHVQYSQYVRTIGNETNENTQKWYDKLSFCMISCITCIMFIKKNTKFVYV